MSRQYQRALDYQITEVIKPDLATQMDDYRLMVSEDILWQRNQEECGEPYPTLSFFAAGRQINYQTGGYYV